MRCKRIRKRKQEIWEKKNIAFYYWEKGEKKSLFIFMTITKKDADKSKCISLFSPFYIFSEEIKISTEKQSQCENPSQLRYCILCESIMLILEYSCAQSEMSPCSTNNLFCCNLVLYLFENRWVRYSSPLLCIFMKNSISNRKLI